MQSILYSFFAGIATSLGVLVMFLVGKPGKRVLASLLGFAGGIMIAISLFELLPEAIEIGSMAAGVIIGFILGVLMMLLLDNVVPHSHMSSPENLVVENEGRLVSLHPVNNPILRTGYLVLFGIGLHNLPEGLAIGAGLESSPELGLIIAVAIALHNIPEGLAMGGPLKAGGMGNMRIFLLTLAAGLMTPVGAVIGHVFFNISEIFIGASLAFAAGAMIYIVNDELVPAANKMHSHLANIGMTGGIIVGLYIF